MIYTYLKAQCIFTPRITVIKLIQVLCTSMSHRHGSSFVKLPQSRLEKLREEYDTLDEWNKITKNIITKVKQGKQNILRDILCVTSQIASFIGQHWAYLGTTWPMLAPWTLLSGIAMVDDSRTHVMGHGHLMLPLCGMVVIINSISYNSYCQDVSRCSTKCIAADERRKSKK